MIGEPFVVLEAELDTLPEGLYTIAEDVAGTLTPKRKEGDYFDLYTDEMWHGPLVLLARVRAAGEIPSGVDSITIRRDGKQVITAWAPDRALAETT